MTERSVRSARHEIGRFFSRTRADADHDPVSYSVPMPSVVPFGVHLAT